MTMLAESIFDCSALVVDLFCRPILPEETLAFMANSEDCRHFPPLEILAQHSKDPFRPYSTVAELS